MRELRDELEVPGHIVMYKPLKVKQIIAEIKQILTEYEQRGITTLKDMPQEGKNRLIEKLDLLGIPHDGLN